MSLLHHLDVKILYRSCRHVIKPGGVVPSAAAASRGFASCQLTAVSARSPSSGPGLSSPTSCWICRTPLLKPSSARPEGALPGFDIGCAFRGQHSRACRHFCKPLGIEKDHRAPASVGDLCTSSYGHQLIPRGLCRRPSLHSSHDGSTSALGKVTCPSPSVNANALRQVHVYRVRCHLSRASSVPQAPSRAAPTSGSLAGQTRRQRHSGARRSRAACLGHRATRWAPGSPPCDRRGRGCGR